MAKGKSLAVLACILGAIGVGIGAMGAHGLPQYLTDRGLEPEVVAKRLDQCETGVRYHLIHALAILTIGLSQKTSSSRWLRAGGWTMALGVLLFSGGIYSIVFIDRLGHWAIVPAGGSLMILGWILACVGCLLQRDRDP